MVPQTPASIGRRWTVFGSHDFEAAEQPQTGPASTSDAAEHYHVPNYSMGSPRVVRLSPSRLGGWSSKYDTVFARTAICT